MLLDLQSSSVSVCCLSPSLGCTARSLLNAWSERKKKKKMRNGVKERKINLCLIILFGFVQCVLFC